MIRIFKVSIFYKRFIDSFFSFDFFERFRKLKKKRKRFKIIDFLNEKDFSIKSVESRKFLSRRFN